MSFNHSHCNYLKNIFSGIESFRKALKRAKKDIKKALKDNSLENFTHIAVTGVSGISFGGALAIALNKNLIVVRKEHEDCHSSVRVEGIPQEAFNYLLVDDLVSSGTTSAIVYSEIKSLNPLANIVSIYQYLDFPFNKHKSRGFINFSTEWLRNLPL